ncbi:MAG: PepSY-associated TM helix domain-containing protein [Pseudomonadota bacterium]
MSGFRQAMTPVHTWAGLILGWILYFVFVTGTLGYFDTEIDSWTRPEVPRDFTPADRAVEIAHQRLAAVAPGADRWRIGLPGTREYPNLTVSWRYRDPPPNVAAEGQERLNPLTGTPFAVRDTHGGQSLYRMHYVLHYVPSTVGIYLVGIATMCLLIALVTGVVIHRKIFREFFTFRPGRGARSWLDFHNVLSVLALPFHLMITYSGLLFFAFLYMPAIMLATYGPEGQDQFLEDMLLGSGIERSGEFATLAPLVDVLREASERWGGEQIRTISVQYPGDAAAEVTVNRLHDSILVLEDALVFEGTTGNFVKEHIVDPRPTMALSTALLGLHEGLFADITLRWLYFLCGVMGSAMIATGLILWSVKRSRRLTQRATLHRGHRLVEVLNIGTVVGLPTGIAAFFCANRLLPLDLAHRAEWETHVLFITWGVTLMLAALRPTARAWTESLSLCAIAFAMVPVLNALTTERHLARSIAEGDWVFAGVDLCMLATGGSFALAAWFSARTVSREARSPTAAAVNPISGG